MLIGIDKKKNCHVLLMLLKFLMIAHFSSLSCMMTIFRNMNRSRSYWIQNQFAFHSGSLMDTTKKKRFVVLSDTKDRKTVAFYNKFMCVIVPVIQTVFIVLYMCLFMHIVGLLFTVIVRFCTQDNQISIAEDEKRKDEELDRQALLAEQRREEERLLQEEQQREKMEKIKAVEGKIFYFDLILVIWFYFLFCITPVF